MRTSLAGIVTVVMAWGAAVAAVPSGAATAPADLTGAQVCALLTPAEIEGALGVTVQATSPTTSGTPQCTYLNRSSAGVTTNVLVAVQRTDGDLDGRTGKKAYKYAVKLNKAFAPKGASFSQLKGVGVAATFAEGSATKLLIVATRDGRVFTIAGSDLTRATATTLGKAVATKLG